MPPKKRKSDTVDHIFQPEDFTTCKACKDVSPSVLRHLATSKKGCLSHYTEEEHSMLKKESTRRTKQKYNKANAESIAKNQAIYDSNHKAEKLLFYLLP